MATRAGIRAARPSPQVVGNAFVHQYYHILHDTPDQMHRFYKDTSSIGRAGSGGVMEYVTTVPEIKKCCMSMDFRKFVTEIEAVDALPSHDNGVLVVVTGYLTGAEGFPRRFTQSFFLAPQGISGYFLLSDILRFISEKPPAVINHEVVNQEIESNQNEGCIAASSSPLATKKPLQNKPDASMMQNMPKTPAVKPGTKAVPDKSYVIPSKDAETSPTDRNATESRSIDDPTPVAVAEHLTSDYVVVENDVADARVSRVSNRIWFWT